MQLDFSKNTQQIKINSTQYFNWEYYLEKYMAFDQNRALKKIILVPVLGNLKPDFFRLFIFLFYLPLWSVFEDSSFKAVSHFNLCVHVQEYTTL
jgi:hypothetical protein